MTYASKPLIAGSGWMISDIQEKLTIDMANELISSFLGHRIGRGVTREVFELSTDPNHVVKIEDMSKGWFANISEFQVWNNVAGTPYKSWFAPIEGMSLGGRMLTMARTVPPAVRDLPEEIPAIFSDIKIENFGMFEGRLVCHDYALLSNRFWLPKGRKIKMQKAFWA